MWKRTSYEREMTTLGEKIITFVAVLLLLAAGFVVFEFAGVFTAVIKDLFQ